jgi:hypothetical protein
MESLRTRQPDCSETARLLKITYYIIVAFCVIIFTLTLIGLFVARRPLLVIAAILITFVIEGFIYALMHTDVQNCMLKGQSYPSV